MVGGARMDVGQHPGVGIQVQQPGQALAHRVPPQHPVAQAGHARERPPGQRRHLPGVQHDHSWGARGLQHLPHSLRLTSTSTDPGRGQGTQRGGRRHAAHLHHHRRRSRGPAAGPIDPLRPGPSRAPPLRRRAPQTSPQAQLPLVGGLYARGHALGDPTMTGTWPSSSSSASAVATRSRSSC
jgi:hypothetical protein